MRTDAERVLAAMPRTDWTDADGTTHAVIDAAVDAAADKAGVHGYSYRIDGLSAHWRFADDSQLTADTLSGVFIPD